MKKLILLMGILFMTLSVAKSQQKNYMVFEFMKVESGNTLSYIEHKDFLEKIYKEAVNSGDIKGWDFWSLKSGTDGGEFHYVTITYYDDPVKMMEGLPVNKLVTYGKKAYSDMSEGDINKRIAQAQKSRDLAVRSYMEEIASTKSDFVMKPGVLASFDLMKATEGRFDDYEKAEREVFLPAHQKKINSNLMGSWSLLRTALPFGSEAKSTHMTLNMYKDYLQFFNSMEYEDMEASIEDKKAVEDGLQSRDQKWVYMATLEKVVR